MKYRHPGKTVRAKVNLISGLSVTRKDREVVTRITHEELLSLPGCRQRIKIGQNEPKLLHRTGCEYSRKVCQESKGESGREQGSSLHTLCSVSQLVPNGSFRIILFPTPIVTTKDKLFFITQSGIGFAGTRETTIQVLNTTKHDFSSCCNVSSSLLSTEPGTQGFRSLSHHPSRRLGKESGKTQPRRCITPPVSDTLCFH